MKMEKSQLNQLVFSFSQPELREIRKFLESPFFNQRADVVQLFDWFCQNEAPEKESAKRHLFGPAPAPDQELRLRMTYLHRLIEQFVGLKELAADEFNQRLHLAVSYRKRGLERQAERTQKQLDKKLTDQPRRDARFFQNRQLLEWEAYQFSHPKNPTDRSHLLASDLAGDVAWFAQKLRHLCLLASHQMVYETDYQQVMESEVLRLVENHAACAEPCVVIYLHGYRMLREPSEAAHFQDFKKLLLAQAAIFSEDETHALYLLAVNYCIRQINAGKPAFFREALDLYKAGLEQGFLFENGLISRFAFSNIVAAGLNSGELDWVRFFLYEYKNRLEKSHREATFSFNLARLEYASRRFDEVLSLLQKANYRDPLHNLAAKTLLLKTFFELGELDLLTSHLDAMRNYIHRKRVLGYHRTNYLNLLKWTDKLVKINRLDKSEVAIFRAAVGAEEVLTEKNWLLEMVVD